MLSKAAKNEIIKEFTDVFKANPSVMLIEYKGLTVSELEGLRTNLKEADTKLQVVKNTLVKIAAKDTDVEQLNDLLVGPTAIAVCESDPTAAAKVFVKTAKDMPSLVIKGGVVEGNVVGLDEITALSKLPSRQEMMAQLLGALSSPMSNLLGSLTQMQSKLLYALEALKDAKEQGKVGGAEEAKPEAKEESKPEAAEEKPVEAKEEDKKEESAKDDSGEAKEEAKAEPVEEVKEEAKEETTEEPEVKAESSEESTAEADSEADTEGADSDADEEENKE